LHQGGLAGTQLPLQANQVSWHQDTAQAHADLLVTPGVEGAGLMDWKQLPRLRKAGRAAARQVLDENQDSIAAWAP
jgi:predicted acylesterase/phospholipase RssA